MTQHLPLWVPCILLTFSAAASAQFAPAPGSPFAAGSEPMSVAVGDFNGDGRLDLAIADPGDTVTVLLGNGGSGNYSFIVPAVGSQSGANFVASVVTHTISGKVTVSGGALGGVTVTLSGSQGGPAATNGSGNYTFTVPPGGNYTVTPSLPGYTFTPAKLVFNNLKSNQAANFVATPVVRYTISGHLTVFASGLSGATVTLSGSQSSIAMTNGSGNFSFSEPAGGNYTVTPSLAGYKFSPANVSFNNLSGNKTANFLLALSPAATAQFSPAPGSPFAVGAWPRSVAVGDFNGDGKADLVIANASDNNVTVLLGNGTGGFTAATGSPFAVGATPWSIAVGDFNGDNRPDLAIANSNANTVTVLLGNLAGGFTAATGSPFSVGASPISIVVADFNGDGQLDLATANASGKNVTVLLGNGAGGFMAAPGIPAGNGPSSITVGDFNGDGKPDLAIPSSVNSTVTVLLGNGTGGFTAAPGSPFPVGAWPQSIAVGDFNGDGKQDLAVANQNDDTVTVLLGNGAGGFTAAASSPFPAGWVPVSMAGGYLNGDGNADLAVADFVGNTVTVLLGNGAGAFTAASSSPLSVGQGPVSVAVGDFNGDGIPDLAIVNSGSNDVTVLVGKSAAIPGDFNGDGHPDLVWQNNTTAQATVNYYGGTGGASLMGWNWLNSAGVPGWKVVGAADFDGNGVPDLVWMNTTTRQVTVNYYGGPGGASLIGWNWLNAGGVPGWTVVAVADFDGNGVPDLIWQNDTTAKVTVNYYGGAGGASLIGWNWLNAGGVPGWRVAGAADFDGNGVPDLIWQNKTTRQVTVDYYGGTGGAKLIGWNWLNTANSPGWSVAGANDYDGNGVPDLVWQNDTTAQVTVNYYGGAGGATLIGWNWLNSAGVVGWRAVVPR